MISRGASYLPGRCAHASDGLKIAHDIFCGFEVWIERNAEQLRPQREAPAAGTPCSPAAFESLGDGTEEHEAEHGQIERPQHILAGGEAVVMQAHAEEVHMPPGKHHDAGGEHRCQMQAPFPDEAAEAGMQDDEGPDDNEQGTVFLRIPTPEAAPGVVGPDPT